MLQQLFNTLSSIRNPTPGALAQEKIDKMYKRPNTNHLPHLHEVHGAFHAFVDCLETLLVEIDMGPFA
jgi:hypothetical protein